MILAMTTFAPSENLLLGSPARSYASAARGVLKSGSVADSDLSADSLEVSHTLETSLGRVDEVETSKAEEDILEELFYGSGRTKSALRASVEASAGPTSSHGDSTGEEHSALKKSDLRDVLEVVVKDEKSLGSSS